MPKSKSSSTSSTKSLDNQHSNSDSNIHSELGQHPTRNATVEDGTQSDSENGETTSAVVTGNGFLRGSVRSDETTVQSNVQRNNTTETLSDPLSELGRKYAEYLELSKLFTWDPA